MSHLSLLLKPASYHCNLTCEYCFYKRVADVYPGGKAGNTSGMMTTEIVEKVIRTVLSLNYSSYSFCWQGGEPTLLGVDFFKTVTAVQKKYTGPGQTIENSFQTNGFLLDSRWARFFNEKQFLVGLSLDGPKMIHDRYRRRAGRGTWDRVMETVVLLRENRVAFNILSLLTDQNVGDPETLYTFFRKHGLNYLQFIPCIEKDPHTGERLRCSVSAEDLGRFYCTLYDRWLVDGFLDVSIRLFEDILLYLLDGVKASCGWQTRCDSYLVVEHNGDVYPCDFFVVPEWNLGNLLEDSLEEIQRSRQRVLFAGFKSELPPECRLCGWKDLCRGDCTRFRDNDANGFGQKSELCDAWCMLLEHIESHPVDLRSKALEARRLHQEHLYQTTGRNDPCPCGSGKKFKKCCLMK